MTTAVGAEAVGAEVRAGAPRVGIAIATRDRRASLLRTLARLRALPERPPIAVADNGSRDGTVAALRAAFGDAADVTLLALGENRGGAARTAAAATLPTPYVAFSDDDSWWEPGALARAAALLDAHPRVGLVAARILVGPQRRLDPTCALMARSPLRGISALAETATGPGIPVLGFLACGAVVRRDAFLAAGGFAQRYGIGGEERLLALDLAADGWQVVYVPEIVACHCPQPGPERAGRAATAVRNDLWSTWLRRPARRIPGASARTLREAGPRSATTRGGAAALRALPWVLRERRPLPAAVEHAVRTLERAQRNDARACPADLVRCLGSGSG